MPCTLFVLLARGKLQAGHNSTVVKGLPYLDQTLSLAEL